MASSKKRKEEKAKLENAETRKKAKPSPKKPKKSNKKTAIQNGTVSESKDEVVVTPASSSINDSQQDSETEQEGRSQEQEATNEKKKKPNKNGKKIERDDDDEVSKVCNFPMGRIKRIFKTQSSDIGITGEAVFLVNKATVPFFFSFLLCLLGFLFETLYFGIVKILENLLCLNLKIETYVCALCDWFWLVAG